MTESVQRKFISSAIARKLMPAEAARMPDVVSLTASDDPDKPIHFWQLYSVLGQDPVLRLVNHFYTLVFEDREAWFRDAFARISGKEHHVQTQAAMWLDCMGGGKIYHGGEYRLHFHHTHNAMQVMTAQGAERWVMHMETVLDDACSEGRNGVLIKFVKNDKTQCARIRAAINTFLGHFMDDYAKQFQFTASKSSRYSVIFGARNPPIQLDGTIAMPPGAGKTTASSAAATDAPNLLNLTEQQIKTMSIGELKAALIRHKVDISHCVEKQDLVAAALRLVS